MKVIEISILHWIMNFCKTRNIFYRNAQVGGLRHSEKDVFLCPPIPDKKMIND